MKRTNSERLRGLEKDWLNYKYPDASKEQRAELGWKVPQAVEALDADSLECVRMPMYRRNPNEPCDDCPPCSRRLALDDIEALLDEMGVE